MTDTLPELIVTQRRLMDRILAHVVLGCGSYAYTLRKLEDSGWRPIDQAARKIVDLARFLPDNCESPTTAAINAGLWDEVYICSSAYLLTVPLNYGHYEETIQWALNEIRWLTVFRDSHNHLAGQIRRQKAGDILEVGVHG